MHILLWMPGGDKVPGGHRVQVEQTGRYLRELGVCARISFDEMPDLAGLDIVHGFGLTPHQLRKCRQVGLPVALSTIYWSKSYTTGQDDAGRPAFARLKARARMGLVLLRSSLKGQHFSKCEALVQRVHEQRISYEIADLLLPNSEAEADAIRDELGVTTPCHVVPNAVDHERFTPQCAPPWAERGHALYVGRFEPHKNQLGLIEATRGSKIPLVLVGPPHPHHAAYYERCKARACKNITILPGVPHNDLPDLYRRARVHVLPSWFETTGLVSLEAALCGCNVVTTDRGYAREYFGDTVWYCDPAHAQSLRQSVETAFAAPPQEQLRTRILNGYTWQHTAQATLRAYTALTSQMQGRL